MLVGERVQLRPVRQADLAAFTAAHLDIRNRGAYFPLGVVSEPVLARRFAENGFWERDEGTLLIWHDEEIVGHIEFFVPVSYWDAFELSYQLYDERHAGHGYTTEAVQLLVDYLTATKKQHRIHLVIAAATRRAAESPRSAGSSSRERCAARSSTTAEPRRAALLAPPERSAPLAQRKPRLSGAFERLRGKDSNLDYLIQSQASYH